MNDIQEIKEKIGQIAKETIISQLRLEQIGQKYRCPDRMAHRHGDRNPSMAWDNELLRFKCFGCGKTIDIYNLYREYLNYSHAEIVREILGKESLKDTSMVKSRVKLEDQAKELMPLTDEQLEYLKLRKIEDSTISAFGLRNHRGSIAFPYLQNGILIGCKLRKPKKHTDGPKYLSLTGSKPGLFNYDGVDPEQPLIISEGEIDTMIVYQSGFQNVVSVGAGANSLKELIEQYRGFLENFPHLIILSDHDEAGANMDKTFLEAFPDKVRQIDKAVMRKKDANEEYLIGGAAAIKKIIESAQEKIEGFFDPDMDETPITEVFGRGKFIPTGIPSIDRAINDLAPGCVTLVAGRSNGGKSTFVNQIVANAIEHENKVFLISGEDDKRLLVNRMYQAVIGRDSQLYDYVQINKRNFKIPRKDVLKDLKLWHKDKIHLFMKGEASLKTTEQLFSMISRKIKADGYNLVVIDNLMSILNIRTAADKYEDQANFVQRCCDLAKLYHTHIIIVLHPNKGYRKGEGLDFEMISGNSDMSNKADNIITIIREYGGDKLAQGIDGYAEIIKNRYFSDLTKVPLNYDKETGLLLELSEQTGACYRYRFNITRKQKIGVPEGFQEVMPWEED
jgi:5S rRNA maturation endonuclease (ribonuclease M5)/archaellum biogenesis ATPase FlaH